MLRPNVVASGSLNETTIPLLPPSNLDIILPGVGNNTVLVFTSVNAVNVFFDYLVKNRVDIRKIKADFAVLGKATKKALIARGIVPSIMAHSFTAEGLFEVLKEEKVPGICVLVDTNNKRAVRFYEKMGFRITGVHPNAIRLKDGTLLNSYTMIKELRQ